MNARDWMLHAIYLSDAVIAAYQRSASVRQLYRPERIERDKMLVGLMRDALAKMGQGEQLSGDVALVGDFLKKYARVHLDHMLDAPEFAEGMAEARELLARVGMVEEVMV
jgi:hypothetical protein